MNKNKNITVDVGQVMFKPTLTISSDVLRQFGARNNAIQKNGLLMKLKMEEGESFLTNIKKNFVNALQWLIGLEIFLLIKDPSKVFLQLIILMEHLLQAIQSYLDF